MEHKTTGNAGGGSGTIYENCGDRVDTLTLDNGNSGEPAAGSSLSDLVVHYIRWVRIVNEASLLLRMILTPFLSVLEPFLVTKWGI